MFDNIKNKILDILNNVIIKQIKKEISKKTNEIPQNSKPKNIQKIKISTKEELRNYIFKAYEKMQKNEYKSFCDTFNIKRYCFELFCI